MIGFGLPFSVFIVRRDHKKSNIKESRCLFTDVQCLKCGPSEKIPKEGKLHDVTSQTSVPNEEKFLDNILLTLVNFKL